MPRRSNTQRRRAEAARRRRVRKDRVTGLPVSKHGRRDRDRAETVVMCTSGKAGFSERVASMKLESFRVMDSRRSARPVRIYLCDLCSAWHLTAMPVAPRSVRNG